MSSLDDLFRPLMAVSLALLVVSVVLSNLSNAPKQSSKGG
jgi:hypothetical protein